MAYSKQTWADNDTERPLSAARMNYIEDGIEAAHNLAGGGSGGATVGAPPYILVASSDAPTVVKNSAGASFTCDGTADQVQVQAAIDLAASLNSRNAASPAQAAQRGMVVLSGGRFNFSAPAQQRTGVAVVGMGWLTEVRAVSLVGTGLFRLADVDAHATHLAHMWLNGNSSAGGGNGVDYDMTGASSTSSYPGINPDSYHVVEDLLLTSFGSGSRTGIKMWTSSTANNRGNFIRQIQCRDASQYGIWLNAASDCSVDLVHIGGSGTNGIRIESGNTRLTNIKTFYSNGVGVYLGSGRHTVAGLESQDDASGVQVASSNASLAGLTIDTAQTNGLLVSGSANLITGVNVFLRGGGRYATMTNGINVTGGTSNVIFGMVDGDNITNPSVGSSHANSTITVV